MSHGFCVCGLYPFVYNNVDYSKVDILCSKIVQKQTKGVYVTAVSASTGTCNSTSDEPIDGVTNHWSTELETQIQ